MCVRVCACVKTLSWDYTEGNKFSCHNTLCLNSYSWMARNSNLTWHACRFSSLIKSINHEMAISSIWSIIDPNRLEGKQLFYWYFYISVKLLFTCTPVFITKESRYFSHVSSQLVFPTYHGWRWALYWHTSNHHLQQKTVFS